MKLLISGILLLLSTVSWAHRGDYLAITDMKITETEDAFVYSFLIENIKGVPYTDVKIDFWINMKSVFFKRYELLDGNVKFTKESFTIPKRMLNIDEDLVNIEITEIFGKKSDWGGWDSQRSNGRQANTLYSEFYLDAPWRMKKLDDQGNINSIPVHFFLHDADLVVGTTVQIDKVDIQLKNATSTTFGSPLKFDSISDADFAANYFSKGSVADPQMSIQGFSLNSFSTSSSTTIDFDINSDFFNDYVEVDATYWYFNFDIPPAALVGFDNEIDIRVTVHYGNLTFTDDVFGMRIFRSDVDIPTLTNYYRGDTHLHSLFTQNDAEIGLPMESTKVAAKHIGLDWITTTDHTSDYDNYGTTVSENWDRIQTWVAQLNAEDPSMIYIAGQEVALKNHEDKLVHMLAYPNMNDPYGLPFIGDGDGDLTATSVTVSSALAQLASINAFAYAAHPYATGDKLPLIPVDGGIWNAGLNSFPTNGSNFPRTGGQIICNNPSASSDVFSTESNKLIKDALLGSQIWNTRSVLQSTGNGLDPWDLDNSGDGFIVADTTSTNFYLKKFRQGQEIVNSINQLGLSLKNQDDNYENWKMYYSAGSDAHGSFNFSNTDDFAGFGTVSDNAVGKLNTLVYCPSGMGSDGTGILEALYHGRNVLSDGPILAIGVSDDGADASNEILMGDDASVNLLSSESYYLNFNYVTTQEFGDVTEIKFIVGTANGEYEYVMPSNWAVTGNNIETLSLNDLLKSTFPSGVIPENENFYIRAEMSCFRDLQGQESVHKISYQNHHSFSNPIWLKYEEVVADVAELTLSTRPNPFQDDFYLLVQTTEAMDVTIGFYDKLGKLIKNEIRYINFNKEVLYSANELGLANGTYTIRVLAGDEKKSIQVVKY